MKLPSHLRQLEIQTTFKLPKISNSNDLNDLLNTSIKLCGSPEASVILNASRQQLLFILPTKVEKLTIDGDTSVDLLEEPWFQRQSMKKLSFSHLPHLMELKFSVDQELIIIVKTGFAASNDLRGFHIDFFKFWQTCISPLDNLLHLQLEVTQGQEIDLRKVTFPQIFAICTSVSSSPNYLYDSENKTAYILDFQHAVLN
ncbi:unnamed protein product [Ambrosiozyma monospora]|uniref:Unnamed protein product n=1 Tax=Ambrosiozyma monospora TaxID=43982 RepID=A0ACB5U4C4_AMBMO|nr:unnamed protein product [Ambrosiozyma monospora]